MNRLIEADYSAQYLFPPSVEDWVPADHPVRFLRDFVDCLDLRDLGFRMPSNTEGGKVYSPSLLMKIWLYAWFEKIRSTRRIARLCQTSLPLMWLAGLNRPDHHTLWRFWKQNRQAIEDVYRQSVRIAYRSGLVGMVLHAVDGTKLVACSARRNALHRSDLAEVLSRTEETIAAMESQLEESEKQVEDGESVDKLPAELADAKSRRERIREQLHQLDEHGVDHLQPSEPDARQLKTGRRVEWAWNAQVVVDKDSGLIVASDLVNEACDAHQLVAMIDKVKENVGEVAATTVADSGYSASDQELADAAAKGYEVVAARPDGENDPYHRLSFSFDRTTKQCICPRGRSLARDGKMRYPWLEGETLRFYCSLGSKCPSFEECRRNPDSRLRNVEISPHHERILDHRKRATSQRGKQLLQVRQELVEPVFGSIKHNDGMRRVYVRGAANARAHWSMMCLVWNLRKLYKSWNRAKPNIGPDPHGPTRCKKLPKWRPCGLFGLLRTLGSPLARSAIAATRHCDFLSPKPRHWLIRMSICPSEF